MFRKVVQVFWGRDWNLIQKFSPFVNKFHLNFFNINIRSCTSLHVFLYCSYIKFCTVFVFRCLFTFFCFSLFLINKLNSLIDSFILVRVFHKFIWSFSFWEKEKIVSNHLIATNKIRSVRLSINAIDLCAIQFILAYFPFIGNHYTMVGQQFITIQEFKKSFSSNGVV